MKKKIIQYLMLQNLYDESFDYLITLLINQITIYNKANRAINSEGISVSGNAEGTYFVRNQHLKTLTECIGNINSLSKKLQLSPEALSILNLQKGFEEDDDGFDL